MNPDVKALWVEALESGDYTQAKGVLHDVEEDSFCCLGVLCDLAVKNGVAVSVAYREGSDLRPAVTEYDTQTTVLPASVQHWAGINSHGDYQHENDYASALTVLNDGGKDFAFIADVIKKEF